jgi:hypothetical protein
MFKKAAHFSKIYYNTSLRDSKINDASGAATAQVRASVIVLLLSVGN